MADKTVEISVKTTAQTKALKAVDKALEEINKELKTNKKLTAEQTGALKKQQAAMTQVAAAGKKVAAVQGKVDAGAKKGTKSTVSLGRATLEASRAYEDLQFGISGVINNIPGLVLALGGSAGLTGVISIAVVAAAQLAGTFDEAATSAKKSADAANEAAAEQKKAEELKAEASSIAREAIEADLDAIFAKREATIQLLDTELSRLREIASFEVEKLSSQAAFDLAVIDEGGGSQSSKIAAKADVRKKLLESIAAQNEKRRNAESEIQNKRVAVAAVAAEKAQEELNSTQERLVAIKEIEQVTKDLAERFKLTSQPFETKTETKSRGELFEREAKRRKENIIKRFSPPITDREAEEELVELARERSNLANAEFESANRILTTKKESLRLERELDALKLKTDSKRLSVDTSSSLKRAEEAEVAEVKRKEAAAAAEAKRVAAQQARQGKSLKAAVPSTASQVAGDLSSFRASLKRDGIPLSSTQENQLRILEEKLKTPGDESNEAAAVDQVIRRLERALGARGKGDSQSGVIAGRTAARVKALEAAVKRLEQWLRNERNTQG